MIKELYRIKTLKFHCSIYSYNFRKKIKIFVEILNIKLLLDLWKVIIICTYNIHFKFCFRMKQILFHYTEIFQREGI